MYNPYCFYCPAGSYLAEFNELANFQKQLELIAQMEMAEASEKKTDESEAIFENSFASFAL